MNIFYLDEDPVKAASHFYDKHKVKMILESAQMLCTAHHHYAELNYPIVEVPYKKAQRTFKTFTTRNTGQYFYRTSSMHARRVQSAWR